VRPCGVRCAALRWANTPETGGGGGGSFWVMVNRGYGFADPVRYEVGEEWPGAYTGMKARFRTSSGIGQQVLNAFLPQARDGIDPISATGTHTVLPTFCGTFTFAVPLLIFAPPFIYIGGGGGDASPHRMSGFELGLQDLDGDGFADHVLKTGENGLVLVRRNQLAGGNLLKKVNGRWAAASRCITSGPEHGGHAREPVGGRPGDRERWPNRYRGVRARARVRDGVRVRRREARPVRA
jgi:hypothetical protein